MIKLNFSLIILTLCIISPLTWRLCHTKSQRSINDNEIYNISDANMAFNSTELYDEIIYILNTGEIYYNNQFNKSQIRYKRIVFPGTLWCGIGKVTVNDDDLGFFTETDTCCREHDLCPAQQSKPSSSKPSKPKPGAPKPKPPKPKPPKPAPPDIKPPKTKSPAQPMPLPESLPTALSASPPLPLPASSPESLPTDLSAPPLPPPPTPVQQPVSPHLPQYQPYSPPPPRNQPYSPLPARHQPYSPLPARNQPYSPPVSWHEQYLRPSQRRPYQLPEQRRPMTPIQYYPQPYETEEKLTRKIRSRESLLTQSRWTMGESNCACDRKFYECLTRVDSFISRQVGKLYFNILHTRCETFDHPIIRCVSRQGFLGWRCIEYQVDTTRPMVLQTRDNPYFYLLF